MTENQSSSSPLIVGLVGLVLAVAFVARLFMTFGVDPTVLIGFGEESTQINGYAERGLGRPVATRPHMGHDGKYFFVQAHDPLLLDPEENILVIDRPIYRSQRMLYPLVAGGIGLFNSEAITWTLLLVNVLAMGAGTYATAVVAKRMGGSPWWGLAFALNVGLVSEISISGAGVMAAALAFGAVAAYLGGREGWGVSLIALSGLSREVMVVVGLGVALWMWKANRRKLAVVSATVPIAVVAAWAVYLRLRLGPADPGGVDFAFELPFMGIAKSVEAWLSSPLDLAGGVVAFLVLIAYTYRTLKSGALVGWAFVGFVPLSIILSDLVWLHYFDITRAVAPLLTAYVLLLFANRNSAGPESRTYANGSLGRV